MKSFFNIVKQCVFGDYAHRVNVTNFLENSSFLYFFLYIYCVFELISIKTCNKTENSHTGQFCSFLEQLLKIRKKSSFDRNQLKLSTQLKNMYMYQEKI